MDIKDFSFILKDIIKDYNIKNNNRDVKLDYVEPSNDIKKSTPYFDDKFIPQEEGIYFQWITGGAEGVNCWRDESVSYDSFNHYAQIPILDEITNAVYPDIEYAQYKEIDFLIKGYTFSNYDYCDNYTSCSSLYIKIDDLYKIFNELGAFNRAEKIIKLK